MNNGNESQQKGSNNNSEQMVQTKSQTFDNEKDFQRYALSEIYDADTRYIIFPLGPKEDQDVQCYTFNILNQYLKQNISICEVENPLGNYKEKYFAKLQPEVDPFLVKKIKEKILVPIKDHIIDFTEKNGDLNFLYDATMVLIKKLNAIKIE